MLNRTVFILMIVTVLTIAGCGKAIKEPFLTISPQNVEISVGEIQYFTATYYAPNGTSVSVTPSWEVTNDIGTIDATGLLTVTSIGTGEIIANYNDICANTKVYADEANYILGELIVKFTEGISVEETSIRTNSDSINALLRKYETNKIEALSFSRVYCIRFARNFNLTSAVSDFKNDLGVEYAQPNYIYTVSCTL